MADVYQCVISIPMFLVGLIAVTILNTRMLYMLSQVTGMTTMPHITQKTVLVNIVKMTTIKDGGIALILIGMSNAEKAGKEMCVESVKEITPPYLTLQNVFQVIIVISMERGGQDGF